MNTKLVYCYVPHFCCGVIVQEDNTIIDAAPILAWAVGKHFRQLRDWLRGKGGNYEVL